MGLDTLDFFGFEEGGSVLGATYAVMFPDHVGKIVLDGMLRNARMLICS